MNFPNLCVDVLPVLEDNFSFLIHNGQSAAVIDPGEAGPVICHLEGAHLKLESILITHYHHDHVAGVAELRRRFTCRVVGPEPSAFGVDVVAEPDSSVDVLGAAVHVVNTPGHAFPHVAYHLREQGWLFSGDCLFGAGCGRLAGDHAVTMWRSLQSLARLPGDTRVFFGHEYTLSNLAFAQSVEPGNAAIASRLASVRAKIDSGGDSVPSLLTEELATNPFLRSESLEIRSRLRLVGASGADVFAALRRAKDVF